MQEIVAGVHWQVKHDRIVIIRFVNHLSGIGRDVDYLICAPHASHLPPHLHGKQNR